jgi:hypothetical protein
MRLLLFAVFSLPWPALAADANLYGQWESEMKAEHLEVERITSQIQFDQDGTFELRIRTVFVPEYDFWANIDKVDSSLAEHVDSTDVLLQGRWDTLSDDKLILTAESAAITINDKDMLEVTTEAVVRTRAIEDGYNEEETRVLIDAIIKLLDPEEIYANSIANFNEENPHYYKLEGNTLVAEINGHLFYFDKVVVGTPVKAWSWGQVKSAR